jgi:hypothetical protein
MEAAVNGLRKAWAAWTGFWFTPADPSTLGFIRVVTGIVLVYTHLVYCFDLTGFFGPNSWYDLASIDRERREYPHIAPEFNSWDDFQKSVYVPAQPHRKAAVVAWMQTITANDALKARTIGFFRDLERFGDYDTPRATFAFIAQLRSDPVARKGQLDAMVHEALRTPLDQTPPAIKSLKETGPLSRESIRTAIDSFSETLSKADDDRTYVLNYLMEQSTLSRSELIGFLERLPADPAGRKELLDYLAYWGFDRGKTLRTGHPIYSMWFHMTGPTEMAVAHALTIVVMLLFTVGLWTRVTSVLTWFLAINYIHRTQYVLFGMDTMSNILLIYLMVGDSGAAFSLDRVIARYRAVRASLTAHGRLDPATVAFLEKPPATMSAGLGTRLMQVHFCFIYMAAGLSKLKGPAWWNHQAYWDTTANPEFTMIYFEWYESAIRFLVQNRWLYSITAALAVVHTFVAEIGLPFLVWTRARPWIMIVGFLLHAGIAIFMGLTVFSLLMMLLLMCYFPGATVRKAIFGTATRVRKVTFNPGDDRQAAFAAKAVAVDTEAGVMLSPDPSATAVSVSVDGKAVPTSDVLRSSFLGWIPGLSFVVKPFWK